MANLKVIDVEKTVEEYRKDNNLSGNANLRNIKIKLDDVTWWGFSSDPSNVKNENKQASTAEDKSRMVALRCKNKSGWILNITEGPLIKGLNTIIQLPLNEEEVPPDVFKAFGQSVYIDPALSVLDKTQEDSLDMTSTRSTKGATAGASAMVSTKNTHYRGYFAAVILISGRLGGEMDVAINDVFEMVLGDQVDHQRRALSDPPPGTRYTESSRGLSEAVKIPVKGYVDFYVSSEAKIEWKS
ncbi:uncharacterized protein LOC131935857 [Physella acuta]|uniref:uncharacterized protein LOC131935857 n=1 Tax=Physella acuta TaxID=109671 RepID=UPI0027DD72EE|nr:uncharacterized protein LOC131935857 [Physella acuta]